MADNTIANAIKFLKGEEKSLPATKTEGQVYFAYKNVGTAEKPSYTGAIYIDTPIGGTQTRVKMTANADIADKAFNDSAGLNIRETYLSSLGYTDDGKQTILIKGSGNNQTRIALPIASTTKSGIVTTDAQSFGGTKTFTTINSTNLTITGPDGFNYSGIETATESKARPVWFADSSGNGKPVVNINFTYNPATQTLSVANLSGTADKANKDNAGNDIRSTYISNITLDDSIMTITKGSGATSTLSIKDKLYSGDEITTKDDLDDFIETNVFKFGHIGPIEGYNGLEKNDGIILSSSWKTTSNYGHQIFIDNSGYALRHRYRNNGNWSDWASILDSTNYNSYAPTKTGGGASGTWGINISGNAASANKLNTNAGSVTQPIYFKDGKPVATTYSLNATVKAGISSRIAYYSGNNEISSASSLKYYTAINNKKAAQTVLRIWGATCGNDATNTISGKASSLSWNDGGPQIQFSTSEAGAQDGALIFTDNDSAGIGASFHFVSSESDWSVVSKRFVAKTSVIIGQESHTVSNQGYNLYVNGTEYIKGVLTAVGDCAFIAHGNEFNFVPTLKATSSVWFNYRQTGGQPTADNFIINEYIFGNGANKALASIKDGLFSGAATYVRDSNNNTNNISITYSKAGQASTSWLASWNGYELGAISPNNITAGKATLLATARKITLAGLGRGSVLFDGSGDVTITDVGYGCTKYVTRNTTTEPYYRIAYYSNNNSWVDASIVFSIDSGFIGGGFGIIKVAFRSNNVSTDNPTSHCEVSWLVRNGFEANQIFVKGNAPTGGQQYADLYYKATGQYQSVTIRVLSSGERGSIARNWIFEEGASRKNADIRAYSYTTYASDEGIVKNSIKWNDYENDIGTNNTSDTWLLVANNNNKIQHKLTTSFATSGHTHNYAGSASVGGSANSAVKLDSSAGSSTQPVYFSGGKPVACTYTLNKSVPADAKFTDTNTWRGIQDNLTSTSTSDSLSANQGRVLKGLIDGKAASNHGHNIIGLPRVTKDANTTAQRNTFKVEEFSNGTNYNLPSNAWYHIFTSQGNDTNYATQLALGMTTTDIAYRIRNGSATAWNGWNTIIHSGNYTSYTVTKTGTGASGTWGINVSGNAATAAKLQTARTISLTGSVTGSGTFDGSGNLSITTSTNHSHSQYLPLAGGTMTGTINFTTNKLACRFGGSTSSYYSGVMHQNFGTEAVVFAATNTLTSFIFKCGQSPISMANNTWANITPSMQIKKQSVYINSLIANGVTPDYNLYVNGTTRCNGTLGVGNGSSAEIDFFPSSSSTIGARIKAYSDRIEFVFS